MGAIRRKLGNPRKSSMSEAVEEERPEKCTHTEVRRATSTPRDLL